MLTVSIEHTHSRRPSHAGMILKMHYLEPLNLTITALAERIGISRKTLSAIVNGRAAVTVDIALRLAKAFNTSPELWLNLQRKVDLWEAQQLPNTWHTIEPFALATPSVQA